MLILLLRIAFVLLAVLIGHTSGHFFYTPLFDKTMPGWFGGAMGFGIAITLIAAEQAFRTRFTRSLVAFLVGLGAGLLLSLLLLGVLRQVIQDDETYKNLDLPLALITTYLVMITVIRGADRFRVVVPFVEFRSERIESGAMVVDAEILCDARLTGLVRSGLLPRRVLVHRQVVKFCEQLVTDEDPVKQTRGKRMLTGLAELRDLPDIQVDIDETEIPNATSLGDTLVRLARLEGARLIANDHEIAKRAGAEGVSIIDLNVIASCMAPKIGPGDTISVTIEKAGEGKQQGVGHLEDGSMVIVGNAADAIGQQVRCTVMRLHSTTNGRMVFAERARS